MMNNLLDKASVYTDFQGLAALKQKAAKHDKSAVLGVAQQLEGVFLQQVLQSMRKANEALNDETLFSSSTMDTYQDMFDQQLSLHLANGDGLGLADVLVQQLGQYTTDKEEANEQIAKTKSEAAKATGDIEEAANSLSTMLKVIQRTATDENDENVHKIVTERKVEEAALTTGQDKTLVEQIKDNITRFASPSEYVKHLYPYAVQVADKFGIDPKMMLAQSALETGWGKKIIKHASGESSHNLFGIKADRRWDGDKANILTTEYRNGVRGKERANFRAYENFKESFEDYVQFLKDNKRYRHALAVSENPEKFIQAIQDAGYATDPNYAAKVTKIFNSNVLNRTIQSIGF